MGAMASAQSVRELKRYYRQLAAKHHPDRGGNLEIMQAINSEYQHLIDTFKTNFRKVCANESFYNLKPGQTIYVNATECKVLHVDQHTFRVVAKDRPRQASFDIKTGVGLLNSRWKASFSPRVRPTATAEPYRKTA
jgi:hypothetical protein